MILAGGEKIGTLRSQEGDVNESTREEEKNA